MTRCFIWASSPCAGSLFISASWTHVELVYLSMIFWAIRSMIGYCCCPCCAWGAVAARKRTGTNAKTKRRLDIAPLLSLTTEGDERAGRFARREGPLRRPPNLQSREVGLNQITASGRIQRDDRESPPSRSGAFRLERQRHRELNVEALAARRELAAEFPEVADSQRSLERRELGTRGVDLRLVLPGDERRVDAGRRRGLPLGVTGRPEPPAEHLAFLAVVVAEPPHVGERVAGLPVLALLLVVHVVEQ